MPGDDTQAPIDHDEHAVTGFTLIEQQLTGHRVVPLDLGAQILQRIGIEFTE